MWPWLFLFLSECFLMFRFSLALTYCHLFWFGSGCFLSFSPLHVWCFSLFFSFGRILNMHILSYFLIATFSSGLNSCNCWCVSAVHVSSVVLVCFGFILSGIFCLFSFFSPLSSVSCMFQSETMSYIRGLVPLILDNIRIRLIFPRNTNQKKVLFFCWKSM